MPRKQVTKEPEYEIEEEDDEEIDVPKISKRTGKPLRKLSELQKEVLRKGRELAIKNKKDVGKISATKKRQEIMKEETLKARETRQIKLKENKENVEKELEETRKELSDHIEPKKEKKKVIKKIIKYVSSSSDSEEEEVIIKKKSSKRHNSIENENLVNDNAVYNLKSKLLNDRLNEMAKLLMPQ